MKKATTHNEDNMKNATISDQTRNLLIALGKLDDLYGYIHNWTYETFGEHQADNIITESVGDGYSSLSAGLYNLLARSIEENRGSANCIEI